MSQNQNALTLANVRSRVQKVLHEDNCVTNVLAKVEDKTKVNREFIAYGVVGFLAFYLMIGWGNDFICNLIGFVWPAYHSIKAIETPMKEDDTKWLMYWCVYGLFGILEYFSDQLLFWIPLYQLTKCIVLIWLMVPGHNGGTYIIYNKILRPFVLKHGDTIDKHINSARDSFDKLSNSLSKKE